MKKTTSKFGPVDIEIQKKIVLEYKRGVRGYGSKSLAKKYGIHHQAVLDIVERAKHGGGVSEPRQAGRKRILTKSEEKRICNFLDKHPDATNERLAKVVKNKIKPRTVSGILARANPPFSRQKFVDREPEEFTDDWKKESALFVGKVRKVKKSRRVYVDESGIFSNDAPNHGRGRVGKKLFRKKKRHGKKYHLHTWTKENRVLYWTLRDKYANDDECRIVAKRACKTIEKGDVVIWDRLGRSGRSRNPKKQHYNPEIVKSIVDRGGEVWYLPPYGKYFNPAELLFNDLKNHYIRPHYGKFNKELSKETITRIVRKYMRDVAPTKLPGFFRARANGAEVKKLGLL